MVQIWGECVPPDVARAEWNGTLLEFEIEGAACLNNSFCQAGDINAICFQVEEGEEGVCQCRQEMQWNSEARECQVEFVSNLGIQASFLIFDVGRCTLKPTALMWGITLQVASFKTS